MCQGSIVTYNKYKIIHIELLYWHAGNYKLSFFIVARLIKTHGSESRGQEEAGLRDEPVSYLQVAPL